MARWPKMRTTMLGPRAAAWNIAACVWCMSVTAAGSVCSRHRRLQSRWPAGPGLRAGISEVCTDAHPHAHERSLTMLHGDVVAISNWTCKDECTPPHPDEAALIEKEFKCMETRQTPSLELQDDIDLGCLGMNLTCEDLKSPTWKNYTEDVYGHCNQDEDLLMATCTLFCRHDMYPTKRCTYKFDSKNKYGMRGDSAKSGMYGFHHCVILKYCNNQTMLEENYMMCNITDTHELIFSSTPEGTTTRTTTSTGPSVASSVGGTAGDNVALSNSVVSGVQPGNEQITLDRGPAPTGEKDGGGDGLVTGAVIGGSVVAVVGFIAIALYFKVCRRKKVKHVPSNHSFSGVVHQNSEVSEGSTVVVGRPVGEGGDETQGSKAEKSVEV